MMFGVSACSTHPQKAWVPVNIAPVPTSLTQAEAVTVAQHFATENGFRLADYQRPELSLWPGDESRPEKSWTVWFWDKPPGHPGGYLWINVDDKTRRAELMPSR